MEYIKSCDLVKIVNKFRKQNSEKIKYQHKSLLDKIRKQIELLKMLGKYTDEDFKEGTYLDEGNRERLCYILTKQEVLLLINNETQNTKDGIINYLENKNKLSEDDVFKEVNLQEINKEIFDFKQIFISKINELENRIEKLEFEKNTSYKEFRKSVLK